MKEFIKKYEKKFIMVTSLLTLSFVFTQCIVEDEIQYFPSSSNGNGISDSLPDGTESAVSDPLIVNSSISIKNFEQINASMSVLTGIPTDDVDNTFDDVKSLLPTTNNVETYGQHVQVAVMKLASEYCHRSVDNSNARQAIWPMVDFGRSPASEFANDGSKLAMINATIERFWGPGLQTGMNRDEAADELLDMFNELETGENNNSTTTRNLVKAVCTATLSSIHVITL